MGNRTEITRKQNYEESQLYERFRQLTRDILHQKTWMWLRKVNFNIETESFRIAAQNITIKVNHIKARIDKTQQNSKCRLCDDIDEKNQSHHKRMEQISTERV